MTDYEQFSRVGLSILFVGALVLFAAELWLLIQSRRGRRKAEPVLLPCTLGTGGLVLMTLSGAIGYSPVPLAAALMVASFVLLVLSAWKMWAPFRDHMRSVGLWKTPEEKRPGDVTR